jgi:hypothetical protein
MKKRAILVAIALILIPTPSSASLNGKEDYSEPRIVAMSMSSSINGSPWANGSGYLYSPRIVFAAGHIKDNNEFKQFYVSQPNQKLKSGMPVVKVIKMFFPNTYDMKIHKDDFAILILEKPLVTVGVPTLINEELLAQAIAAKIPMKSLGFGAYQDVCAELKVPAPCEFGSDRTSLVPRSIEMTPWSSLEIKDKFGRYDTEVADHLFLTTPYKGGPCGGDSGGSTTVSIDGKNYYVGTVASGHWNAYACGQSGGSQVGDTIGFTAPVYKFLDLIKVAEEYVAQHPYSPAKVVPAPKKSTPTKVVNRYQYIIKFAKGWAKFSTASDTALIQCKSARDKGVVIKQGKPVPIGKESKAIRRDLNTYPGFKACLDGFAQ